MKQSYEEKHAEFVRKIVNDIAHATADKTAEYSNADETLHILEDISSLILSFIVVKLEWDEENINTFFQRVYIKTMGYIEGEKEENNTQLQ